PGSLASLRLASSIDIGPESFQVPGEEWRGSSPSPGDTNPDLGLSLDFGPSLTRNSSNTTY
ncbi:hypothetical protein A2U01_0069812, partial [Trifolium medium]|nr:hypothetical protein [Trifolium medium]